MPVITQQPPQTPLGANQLNGQLQGEDGHWDGLPIFNRTAAFDEIAASVPSFNRIPFCTDGEETANPYFHVVSRAAVKDSPAIPVGLVSPTYRLIQHSDVFAAIRTALSARNLEVGTLECHATFTIHSERMALRVNLPTSFNADVGDGNPIGLQVCCFNSVDGRSSFALYLGWFRFVCGNGIVVGTTAAKLRRAHRESLQLETIGTVLREGMEKAARERKRFAQMIKEEIPDEVLRQWADGPLANKWGVKAATRALHIIRTGHDCNLALPFEKALPSERAVISTKAVPGSLPAPASRFSVMQALSWLASHRNAMQERTAKTQEIALLMARLPRPINADKLE